MSTIPVPFRFVFAAYHMSKHGGLGAYVKYKNNKDNSREMRVKEWQPAYCWLDLPDREVVLVSDAHKLGSFVPWGHGFDEFVDLDIASEFNASRMGTDMVMLNYHAHEKSGVSPDFRLQGRGDSCVTSIADSGGFQLVMGMVEFINPHRLIEWYNANTDLGMVLDIPPVGQSGDEYQELLRRGALVQKTNTDLMLAEARPGLELINVLHGQNWDEKQRFFDVVHDPRITRMALGGEYAHNLVKCTYNILNAIHEYREEYKHFHILGVYSLSHLAVFIRLAKYCQDKGWDVLITSDSSTHIQSAVNKTYHAHLGLDFPPKRMIIGDKTRLPTAYSQLGCQCPVCRAIKYEDVMNVLDNATMTFILASHNAFDMARYVQQITDLCGTVSDDEYRKVVVGHSHGERSTYLQQSLALIRDVEQDGMSASVLAKYRYFIPTMATDYKELPAMLSDTGDGTSVEVDYEDVKSHVAVALDRFEAFHASPEEKAKISEMHGKKTDGPKRERLNKGGAFIGSAGLSAQKKAVQKASDAEKAQEKARDKERANPAKPAKGAASAVPKAAESPSPSSRPLKGQRVRDPATGTVY